MKILFTLTAVCISTLLAAQLTRSYTIPVSQNNITLHNPWAGGLNSCQISTLDANMDGLDDLFVFDRIGARFSIYINMDGTPGAMNYKYTLQYNNLFPTTMRNRTLLRDMNCDGKKDICTNSGSGFKIYWNTSETSLTFDLTPTTVVTAAYDFPGGTSPDYNAGVFSIAPDLPAIDDYDGDGDMDVWGWGDAGNSIFFYKNYAVENGDCGTHAYEFRNRCYGEFLEAVEGFTLYLDTICTFNTVETRSAEPAGPMRHTGGTILTLDLDNNGMKDLVLSDVTETNDAALLIVDGSDMVDSAVVVHFDFPAQFSTSNAQAVDLPIFPGNFYEDVNNDGVKDLIVSPNDYSDAEDRFGMWLYLNEGTNSLPDFAFHTYTFLQDEQIDIGTSCFPVAFDVNTDGLYDLLISNRLHFDAEGDFTSRLVYYQNTGNAQNPAFTLMNENWMDMSAYGFESVHPTFGDVDDDGDSDMILGEQNGFLHLFRNTAGAGQPCVFELQLSPMTDAATADLDVGQNAAPQLIDLNEDGLLDLITGELNGCVSYFQNIGTEVQYNYQLIEDSIGDAVATSALGIQGKSIPFLFKNDEGLWQLLLGTETGKVNHYNNIEGNLLGSFNLVTQHYEGLYFEGFRSAVFMQDLNADDEPDLLLGNVGGGLGIYMSPGVEVVELTTASDLLLYPNPSSQQFILQSEKQQITSLTIYDASGRIVEQIAVNAVRTVVDTHHYPQGIYHVSVQVGNASVIKKLVVLK